MEAKHHCLTHGRGMPVPHERAPRWDVSLLQIEHFMFMFMLITSPHIMQDLPFGQHSIMLSDKTTIKVPNVIRTLIPERMVQQYTAYCDECNFRALSRIEHIVASIIRLLSVFKEISSRPRLHKLVRCSGIWQLNRSSWETRGRRKRDALGQGCAESPICGKTLHWKW